MAGELYQHQPTTNENLALLQVFPFNKPVIRPRARNNVILS
jgi:hypothetical protein